jgi:hypothetical protein
VNFLTNVLNAVEQQKDVLDLKYVIAIMIKMDVQDVNLVNIVKKKTVKHVWNA